MPDSVFVLLVSILILVAVVLIAVYIFQDKTPPQTSYSIKQYQEILGNCTDRENLVAIFLELRYYISVRYGIDLKLNITKDEFHTLSFDALKDLFIEAVESLNHQLQ